MTYDFPERLTAFADEDSRRLWECLWKLVERLNLNDEALKAIQSAEAETQAQQAAKAALPNNLRAARIPFGNVTSNSNTVFTATVPGVVKLEDGVCAYIKNNGNKTSTNNWTLNVNGLGAKPVYQTLANNTRVTTQFAAQYTFLFVYNSTRIAGGCWDMYYGYNTDTQSTAYIIRRATGEVVSNDTVYGYRLCFTDFKGKLVPVNTVATNAERTQDKTLTARSFDPFAPIYYFYSGNSGSGGTTPNPQYLMLKYHIVDMRFSFNIMCDFVSNPLDYPAPVYLVCEPAGDGQVTLASTPIAQELPSSADGKVYVYLGRAWSESEMELDMVHPVYYYDNGVIKQWTG